MIQSEREIILDRVIAGGHLCVVTDTLDEPYRQYLCRKVREQNRKNGILQLNAPAFPAGTPLDLSVHDDDDDIVAGLSAVLCEGELVIVLLWSRDDLGMEARLVALAEAEAERRGCMHDQKVAS